MNEVKGGVALYDYTRDSHVTWMGGCFPDAPVDCGGSVTIGFRGYSVGSAVGQHQWQNNYSIRDDFASSFTMGGRHDVKIGGEHQAADDHRLVRAVHGAIEANGGPIPANIEQLFPVWNDASTWNLAALSPITVRVRRAVSNTSFHYEVPQDLYADGCRTTGKLPTHAEPGRSLRRATRRPFGGCRAAAVARRQHAARLEQHRTTPGICVEHGRPHGAARRLRAFFTQVSTDEAHQSALYTVSAVAERLNDGRADFAENPFNGPVPSFEEVLATACDVTGIPSRMSPPGVDERNQSSVAQGVVLASDLGWCSGSFGRPWRSKRTTCSPAAGARRTPTTSTCAYDPATGVNYPFRDIVCGRSRSGASSTSASSRELQLSRSGDELSRSGLPIGGRPRERIRSPVSGTARHRHRSSRWSTAS